MFNSNNNVKEVQDWIISVFDDPLAKTLLNHSHLTKIQLETFLIDSLAESILDKKIRYADKSKMRISAKGVSRGAFNRTLHQAKNNIMSSIYTILCLGYLGILDTPSLDPFIEMSNKLATYVKEYLRVLKGNNLKVKDTKKLKMMSVLKEELILSLNSLLLTKK